MLTQLPFQSRHLRQSRRGWTLVEMSVAVTIGLIVMAAFLAITISINTSLVAIGNYNDLDKASRYTLDRLTSDIRNSTVVMSSSSSGLLTVTNTFSGTSIPITYSWDGSNVMRSENGGSNQVMLTSCDYLKFSYFIRIPTNNFQFVSITNALASTNQIKLISVSWRCSRSVFGSKLNTESVQTANIVIRN